MNPDKYRVVAIGRWQRPGESPLEREFDTKAEAQKFAKTVDLSTYFRPHIQKVRSNPPSENAPEWRAYFVMKGGGEKFGVWRSTKAEASEDLTQTFKDPRVEWRNDLETYGVEKKGANPARHPISNLGWPEIIPAAAASNPPSAEAAAEIYEGFTGRESKWVTVAEEPHMPKGDYAQLGKLLTLCVKPLKGGQVLAIEKFDGDPPLVVSDVSQRQIYFFQGNQDISDSLQAFGARDRGNGVYELGEGREIHYQGRKEHVAHPEEDRWRHLFGEENGRRPAVLFDSRHKKLLLEGGDYRIDGAWIRN